MATVSEITQNIITQARLIDPNMSLEVGTPERKIVEAVAESIAAATVDIDVLSGQLYLDELSGTRLDSFVSLFGFGRQLGARATGIVTVSRPNVAAYNTTIPKGTQFATTATGSTPGLIFVATETVTLSASETRALVRVECTTAGTIGNVPVGAINAITSTINMPGVTSITNEIVTSGGVDTETDAELKARFQNSIFRNMSGTMDYYLALSLSHPMVTKANVIGPQSKYIEYIQTPKQPDNVPYPFYSGNTTYTTSISSVPYSKYTYSNNYYVTKGSGKGAAFLRPGKDFGFNNPARLVNGAGSQGIENNPVPNITMLGPGTMLTVDGVTKFVPFKDNVFLFEHTYLSRASRNEWLMGITNCVDIYVNGQQKQLASSEEAFPSGQMTFVNDPTNIAYNGNYIRAVTNEVPQLGNFLHILYHQPMTDIPSGSIQIEDRIYYEARYQDSTTGRAFTTVAYRNPVDGGWYQDEDFTVVAIPAHYFIIKDTSTYGGTVRARNGIEWLNSVQEKDKYFNVQYNYDISIEQLQATIEGSKPVTTDVLVHSSSYKYLKLYITVMYTPGFTETNVNKEIAASLSAFFNTQYFGTTVQMSDLLQTIHNTNGVDNVRWTYETPINDINNPRHKIEIVTEYGNSFTAPVYFDQDFILDDNELPALPDIKNGQAIENALVIQVKAQNTWESN